MTWLTITSNVLKLFNAIAGWLQRKEMIDTGRTLQSHESLKEHNRRVDNANKMRITNKPDAAIDSLYDRDKTSGGG